MKINTKQCFILIFLLISIEVLGGCIELHDEYSYSGVESLVYFSHISKEEMNNSSLKIDLINQLETKFSNISIQDKEDEYTYFDPIQYKSISNISVENEPILIWYNGRIYVGYNDLYSNKLGRYQCSRISFLSNKSIEIWSKVKRYSEFTGDEYSTEDKALEKSMNLYINDKEFLGSRIEKIIGIVTSIYLTEVIYNDYFPRIR